MRHDERIAILQRTTARNAAGEKTDDWTPLPEIWANAQFPTGAGIMRAANDELRAGVHVSIVRASFRIWSDPSISIADRVRHSSGDYKVNAVVPDSTDRRFMFLACERVT